MPLSSKRTLSLITFPHLPLCLSLQPPSSPHPQHWIPPRMAQGLSPIHAFLAPPLWWLCSSHKLVAKGPNLFFFLSPSHPQPFFPSTQRRKSWGATGILERWHPLKPTSRSIITIKGCIFLHSWTLLFGAKNGATFHWCPSAHSLGFFIFVRAVMDANSVAMISEHCSSFGLKLNFSWVPLMVN